MLLTILFVVAASITLAFVSWTVGYHMSLTSYALAKKFYIFKSELKATHDTTRTG